MNDLRVGLISINPFPKGNVATLRYSSYLESLSKIGCHTKVFIYAPSRTAAQNKDKIGSYKGITYEYLTKITWGKKDNSLIKLYYLLLGLLKLPKALQKEHSDIIILYGDNPFILTVYIWLLSKLLNFALIGDRSENAPLKTRSNKIRMLFYKLKNRLFDGMIIMTEELGKYYTSLRKSKPVNSVFILPMTMDMNRFDSVSEIDREEPYICVVFGTHNRDGLAESILAYIRYVNDYGGTYRLKLIGNFDKMPNKEYLSQIICQSGLNNKIEIEGLVQISEVPQYLYSASCLLTTPKEYISGGFPTKIGEYMLSGTPIVCTSVYILTQYLEENKDIIFASIGDIDDIAKKLLWVEQNPSKANNIAQNALAKVKERFNADSYAIKLKQFFSHIYDTNKRRS